MRARSALPTLVSAVVVIVGASCGETLVAGTFTSRVVQHETCRVQTGRPQTCEQTEKLAELTVRLDENADDDTVWLSGIPKSGGTDRAILGSRDDEGGWLFVDEAGSRNSETTCAITSRLEISMKVDPNANPQKIGADPCIALVGRETATTVLSSGCDTVNTPALNETRIERRRWEPSTTCGK